MVLKAWQQLHKNAASHIEHVLEAIPYKTVAARLPTTHQDNYPNKKKTGMQDTAREVRTHVQL